MSGIPDPDAFIPGGDNPPTELMGPISLGGVDPGVATEIPLDHITSDTVFSHRFELIHGYEPQFGSSAYSASPSAEVMADDDLLFTYSRGTSHTAAHIGKIAEGIPRDIAYMPQHEDPWPDDPDDVAVGNFPHGDLHDAASYKRSFTISKLEGEGVGGVDRYVVIINETNLSVPPETHERYVFTFWADDTGGSLSWSAGAELPGDGDEWNSVGRARVFSCNSGDHCFGYYAKYTTSTRYDSRVAKSTDGGKTWTDWVVLAQFINGGGGTQYEEPYCDVPPGGTSIVCLMRVDQGLYEIHRTESTDDGATWSTPTIATDGWQHPVYKCRDTDNVCLLLNRPDGPDEGPCLIRKSTDRGVSWSDPVDLPPATTDRCMQGDIWLTADNRFGIIWAEDVITARTRMSAGLVDECVISGM